MIYAEAPKIDHMPEKIILRCMFSEISITKLLQFILK